MSIDVKDGKVTIKDVVIIGNTASPLIQTDNVSLDVSNCLLIIDLPKWYNIFGWYKLCKEIYETSN